MWRTNVWQMDWIDRKRERAKTRLCTLHSILCTICIYCGLIGASATLKVHQLSSCHRVNGKNIKWKIEKKVEERKSESERWKRSKKNGVNIYPHAIHIHTHTEYHSNCIECRKLLQALLHTFAVHLNTRYSQCRWFNEFTRDDTVRVFFSHFCTSALLSLLLL